MSDPVWRRDEIESPCINVCVLHPQAKLCMGCFRSADEITQWSRMTPQVRRDIMDTLPEREKDIPKKRLGGRKARLKRRLP